MPIKPTKQNKPQPRFLKESVASSVDWDDSPAGRNFIAGNEPARGTDVREFTAVWGRTVWGSFAANGPSACDASGSLCG
jgi:hypothetical protein